MTALRFRVRPSRVLLLALAISILFNACAGGRRAPEVRPGTGDVSFRLLWEGEADLDLHVIDPLGRHTGIALLSSRGTPEELLAATRAAFEAQLAKEQGGGVDDAPPAGVLDIDCNASPHQICPRPIENVFWPTGTAQRGDYAFWVHLFQPLLEVDRVAFTLEVRRGEQVVERIGGTVGNDMRTSERYAHVF